MKPESVMRALAITILAVSLFAAPSMAKPPQVLPDQMFGNLFALTQAATVLKICADSDAWAGLPDRKKQLHKRLLDDIDGLVHKIARKFDNDVFEFYASERDKTARDPDFIKHYSQQYGVCGDQMFDRMQWYVYDSRQKLDLFLSELPDAK
jgi:hypothetical protein